MLHTLTRAAQILDMPPSTLLSWEQRGLVGPFQRNSAGHRQLTDADIAEVRRVRPPRRLPPIPPREAA